MLITFFRPVSRKARILFQVIGCMCQAYDYTNRPAYRKEMMIYGGPTRTRTWDLPIMSRTL